MIDRIYRSSLSVVCLMIVVLIVAPGTVDALMIDPPPGSSGSAYGFFSSEPLGQSFIADVSDVYLVGMSVSVCNCPSGPFTSFNLSLFEGEGFTGTLLGNRTATAASGLAGFLYFDFSGTSLTMGNMYTAQITRAETVSTQPLLFGSSGNVYGGGSAFTRGHFDSDYDFFLRVLDTSPPPPPPTGIPEPSSIVLLGLGLCMFSMIVFRRVSFSG